MRAVPPRPVSYVTSIPSAAAWRGIMEAYRAGPRTLGVWVEPGERVHQWARR